MEQGSLGPHSDCSSKAQTHELDCESSELLFHNTGFTIPSESDISSKGLLQHEHSQSRSCRGDVEKPTSAIQFVWGNQALSVPGSALLVGADTRGCKNELNQGAVDESHVLAPKVFDEAKPELDHGEEYTLSLDNDRVEYCSTGDPPEATNIEINAGGSSKQLIYSVSESENHVGGTLCQKPCNKEVLVHSTQYVYDGGGTGVGHEDTRDVERNSLVLDIKHPTSKRHAKSSQDDSQYHLEEEIALEHKKPIVCAHTGECGFVHLTESRTLTEGGAGDLGKIKEGKDAGTGSSHDVSWIEEGHVVPASSEQTSVVLAEDTSLPGCGPTCEDNKARLSKRFIQSKLRHKSKCRSYKLLGMAAIYLSAVSFVVVLRVFREPEKPSDHHLDITELGHRHRRFAETTVAYEAYNTTEEQCDPDAGKDQIKIMTYEMFINGGWIVHVIIGVYTFAAIASICDIYFVPALEHICEDLKLEADVAGATFMAAASSAPEFCTSIIGTFVHQNDVGLGAIVGSSIFNLLAIVGLCGIFAGAPVELSWYPLTRDSMFYTLAVTELLIFMYDSAVTWHEALTMVCTYLLYIIVMIYNKNIEDALTHPDSKTASRQSSFTGDMHRTTSARIEIIRARSHSRTSSHGLRSSISRMKGLPPPMPSDHAHDHSNLAPTPKNEAVEAESFDKMGGGTSADPKKQHILSPQVLATPTLSEVGELEEEDAEAETGQDAAVAEYENPLEMPESCVGRVYWVLVLPITVLHAFTIPDSRIQDSWQSRLYMIPFVLSVVYLAIYSYIMVWALSVAAWALHIPATVTGLTILAAGTSVPDCLSSIFVARDGYGDMAVSNAIGSNVFDILLCLGVPWLLSGFVEKRHAINSEGMWVAGATLIVTIFYLMCSLKVFGWTLTPVYGFVTLLFYVVIIGFCIMVEMNIIFNLHPDQGKCQDFVAGH